MLAPPWGVGAPSLGKSWIRHCAVSAMQVYGDAWEWGGGPISKRHNVFQWIQSDAWCVYGSANEKKEINYLVFN